MKKKALILINVLLLIALAGFGGYYFKKYRDTNAGYRDVSSKYDTLINDPQIALIADTKRYTDEVSKVYDLPKDETPTVATVEDKEKLKDQPFFDKSEKGDIAFIYPNAKLAVLYRPSTKQVINVSSVSIDDTQQGTAPVTPPPAAVTE